MEQKELKEGAAKRSKEMLIWVERDGTRTPIAAMSDHHLKYSMQMVAQSITARKFWRSAWLPYLKEEARYRRALTKRKENLNANADQVSSQKGRRKGRT